MNKVYQIVQSKIIQALEKAIKNGGTAPWQKEWTGMGKPKNYITKKEYSGINLLLLDEGEYITFNQIQELRKKDPNIKLKKGSKANLIVFWKMVKKKSSKNTENEEEDEELVPILRYYNVFNILDVQGISLPEVVVNDNPCKIEKIEKMVNNYSDKEAKINIINGSNSACYYPKLDIIQIPCITQFNNEIAYYSTLFHEMVHSTGHSTRLDRFKANTKIAPFGSADYSKEELIAEIGSNMLLGSLGINNNNFNNSVSYLYSWLEVIKKDTSLIISAAQKAQKAVDYLLNFQ